MRQFLDENRPLPNVDITSSILKMFLNIPILVIKTSFTTKVLSTRKGSKKHWNVDVFYTMDCDKTIPVKDFNIILVDNNEGFVAPAVAEAQVNLHEDIVSSISALEDTIDSFKSLGKGIPEGTDMYKCINLININLKAARSLAVFTNCATGEAQVTTKNAPSSVPLPLGQQLLEPQPKRRKVTATVSVNPEKDTTLELSEEETAKLKAQDPALDQIGGWF